LWAVPSRSQSSCAVHVWVGGAAKRGRLRPSPGERGCGAFEKKDPPPLVCAPVNVRANYRVEIGPQLKPLKRPTPSVHREDSSAIRNRLGYLRPAGPDVASLNIRLRLLRQPGTDPGRDPLQRTGRRFAHRDRGPRLVTSTTSRPSRVRSTAAAASVVRSAGDFGHFVA
jgi:hypothetical protein